MGEGKTGTPERFVSWWIKWEDLNWPSTETLDRIREFLDDAKTPPRRVARKAAKA